MTRPEAVLGETWNSPAYMPMYTDGPRRAEFPRNEYSEQAMRMSVFLASGH